MSSLPETVQVGEWRVEPELDLIARNGQAVKIEPRAMRVLLCLVARPGHIVSVSKLLEEVWPDVVVGPDSVYQAISLLRRTLGDDSHHPTYIAHVPRKGYRLVAPVGAPATGTQLAPSAPPAGTRKLPPALMAASLARAAAAEPDSDVVDASVVNGFEAGCSAADGRRANGFEAWGAASVAAIGAPAISAFTRANPRRLGGPVTWGALVIAVAALGVLYLFARNAQRAPPSVTAAPAATPTVRPGSQVAPTAPSIAVLPFVDMSEKQDLGYFADGLTEELIDLLSRGSDLRVPARTSSFYFKGKSATVHDIAGALHVESLLEGSVRRSGKRVRVTAQLIRADTGYHLWSQTYDRELTEIFEVEDEIARAVTRTLQAKLNTSHTSAGRIAANGEAHNLQLQCQFFVQRNTKADAAKAIACYRQLLDLAPRDATAWAAYADAVWRQPLLSKISLQELHSSAATARQAAEHAIALDPAVAAPHAVLAVYHRVIDRDWVAANAEVEAALTANPTDPMSLLAASRLAMTLGQFDRALRFLARAQERDPLNFIPYARFAIIYLYQGRLAEAETAVRHQLDVAPETQGGYELLADVLLARDQPQAALEAMEQEREEENRLIGLARVYYALGRRADSDTALAELILKFPGIHPTHCAEIYAYRGQTDRAFAALDEAYASGDPNLSAIKTNNYFKPLRADPRYQALLKKLNLPEHGPD